MGKPLIIDAEVRAKLQAQTESLRALRKTIENQFSDGISDGLKKEVNKLKSTVEKSFQNLDIISFSEAFDAKDLKAVEKNITSVSSALQKMANLGLNASFQDLDANDTFGIQAQIKALKDYEKEFYKFYSSLSKNYGDFSFSKGFKKKTGFSEKNSYSTNLGILRTQQTRSEKDLPSLQANAERAAAEYEQAKQETLAAKTALQAAKGAYNKVSGGGNRQAKQKFLNVQTNTKKGYGKNEIIANYSNALTDVIQGEKGGFRKDGKNMARVIGSWLDMSDEEINIMLSQKAEDVVSQLQEKLKQSIQNNLKTFTSRVKGEGQEKLLGSATQEEIEQKQFALESAKAIYSEKKTVESTKEAAAATAQQSISDTQALIDEIKEQVEKLKELQEELDNLPEIQGGKKYIAEQRQSIDTNITETRRPLDEVLEKSKEELQEIAKSNARTNNDVRAENEKLYALQKEQEQAEKEAETFNKNLSNSISRWMSAAQIVQIIKQGVRSAYSDIKELDATMTNIAVVTDMSVSDLWGQIEDYMAVAQQYGVTTKGVYEVSQLFYQQGLQSSEVMELTTETLKMARQQPIYK